MFTLVGFKILVRPDNPKQFYDADGKLIIPEAFRIQGKAGLAIYGAIEQIGQEVIDEKDTLEYLKIKVGDKVIFDRYVGAQIKIDGIDYRIIQPDDILAVCVEE